MISDELNLRSKALRAGKGKILSESKLLALISTNSERLIT